MNFKELELPENILTAIEEIGFKIPTPIQEKVIPQIIAGRRDIVGLAQTGTGKTAAYGLPILSQTDIHASVTQTLILCPTRELCLQITRDIENFARHMPRLSVTAVYGGAGIVEQMKATRKGTHIIVATPGRLLDLIKRKAADISAIRYLVLDEADIMLNMGFKEELDAILAAAPAQRQTLLFSATMPVEVSRIAASYMVDPVEISIGQKNSGTAAVEHQYVMVHARDKYQTLKRVVDHNPAIYGIIFCRTRAAAQEVADRMTHDGYQAEALHGDMSQAQREFVMSKFRSGHIRLLIATDIAARGLDVNDLTHVIHYDLPDDLEAYTHRSGRTGRAGKTGMSLAIINMKEKYKIERIEKSVKRRISAIHPPAGKDICQQQLLHLMDKIRTAPVNRQRLAPYLPMVVEKMADLDRETLLSHVVSLEFNRILEYYKDMPDLASAAQKPTKIPQKPAYKETGKSIHKETGKSVHKETGKTGYTYLVVNIGKNDHVLPPQLIGLVNQSTRNRYIRLGKIDISANTSRIQVENVYVEDVVNAICGYRFCGKKLSVEKESSPRTKSGKRGGQGSEVGVQKAGGRVRESGAIAP